MGYSPTYSATKKLSDDLRVKCQAILALPETSIQEECSYPQPYGNAWVIAQTGKILLRFIWERNLPRVEVKFEGKGDEWEELAHRIAHLAGHDVAAVPFTWEQWSKLFMKNQVLLEKAAS